MCKNLKSIIDKIVLKINTNSSNRNKGINKSKIKARDAKIETIDNSTSNNEKNITFNLNLPKNFSGNISLDEEKLLLSIQQEGKNNIAKVLEKTKTYLQNENESVSNENISLDSTYALKFFDAAKNITNEELQDVLAKILANTIIYKDYNYRVVDIAKNLTPDEINVFKGISKKMISDNYIPINAQFFDNKEYVQLESTGLLNNTMLEIKLDSALLNKNLYMNVNNDKEIKELVIKLTNEGCLIRNALKIETDDSFCIEYAKHLYNKYPDLKVSLHKVVTHESSKIKYYEANILNEVQDEKEN